MAENGNVPVTLNGTTVRGLIDSLGDDAEMLDLMEEMLTDFENYHQSVYRMEISLMVRNHRNTDTDRVNEMTEQLDKARTGRHDKLLDDIILMNRMAAQQGLPPVYDGTVSKERPYRRQVANAVFAYVEEIIHGRR
ncbi:MAG: DUF3232 domain-containing protein [Clostridia bacterium]|nr:DUF3232 domain-containing protein [Clostridia bacterium]